MSETKLREEWFKTDLAKKFAPFEDAVPSFFITKRRAELQALLEEVKGMKKIIPCCEYDDEFHYNQGISSVEHLITALLGEE